MSNDLTMSTLHGPIPPTFENLVKLKCLYLSHTGVEGNIPRGLEKLGQLQVFLMRGNQLTGPLIDFSRLPHLKNVWFDTNKNLTGSLAALGALRNLTFLQASNNALSGSVTPTRHITPQNLSISPSFSIVCSLVLLCCSYELWNIPPTLIIFELCVAVPDLSPRWPCLPHSWVGYLPPRQLQWGRHQV
jgi:hypothetical protein